MLNSEFKTREIESHNRFDVSDLQVRKITLAIEKKMD